MSEFEIIGENTGDMDEATRRFLAEEQANLEALDEDDHDPFGNDGVLYMCIYTLYVYMYIYIYMFSEMMVHYIYICIYMFSEMMEYYTCVYTLYIYMFSEMMEYYTCTYTYTLYTYT